MANDTIYLNPQGEFQAYTFDFADDLPDDTALNNIGSGSTINAYSSAGTDVGSVILIDKVRTAMTLIAGIGAVTDGEDYRIEFKGQGATTGQIYIKVLELRARRYIQGAV